MSEHQESVRDLSVLVSESVTHEELQSVIAKGQFVRDVALADLYRGTGIAPGKKSVTYTLTLGAPDRTLTSEEIDASLRGIGESLQVRCAAELR